MENNIKDIGLAIKHFRQEKKMDHQQLADAAGINPSYVSLIESGNRIPKLEVLAKIADALDVHISTIFVFLRII